MPPIVGTGANGVCLLGEAYGEKEAIRDTPFVGPAGFRLEHLIQQLGARREEFLITNVCWERPQGNREPTLEEIDKWRPQWTAAIRQAPIKVVVPLGNVPLRATLSFDGIQQHRGYLSYLPELGCWVLPTVHPAFLLRGNANWTAAWLRDVEMALKVAQEGPPPSPQRELTLDPSPQKALDWKNAWGSAGCPPLAFDIETPYEKDQDDTDIPDTTTIYRIGFAWRRAGVTHALSIPWGTPYLGVVRALLETGQSKVVWNRHFDVPRMQQHHVAVGHCHDAQEMWHVFHSDLPKKLGFVAPFLIPGQPYWKDQSHKRPAYYNATDAAVTVEIFEALWE